MANELVLIPEVNTPCLLNDEKERQVKVKLTIHPSDEVRKQKGDVAESVGSDICIVLDVSQSMRDIIGGDYEETGETIMSEGELRVVALGGISKLNYAISAIEKLIPKLREEDTLSLIAYEDNSHIIFQGYTSEQRQEMLQKLKLCYSYTGNTNISGALREARYLLNDTEENRPKRIIFLTDGNPVGDTEEAGILEGEMLAEHNISIDCLGLGDDFNLAFINKIAAPSKGRTQLIELDKPEEIEWIFSDLFEKSQNVLATNVSLQFKFSQQVRVTDHYRGVPENMYLGKVKMVDNDRTVTLNLGQIETNQRYEYYFLITVPAQPGYVGKFRLLQAEATYYLPGLQDSLESSKKSVEVEFVDNPTIALKRNGEVESGYSQVEIMRMLDEIDELLKQNENGKAGQKYQQIIDKYETLGMSEEVKLYRQLLENLKKNGKITLSDMNRAHSTSSKAADSGEMSPVMTEADLADIFD